jgi:transposase InsO family protein
MLMRIKPALIIQTLKRNNFNTASTALELGLHRTTIWRWALKARRPYHPYLLSTRGLHRKSTRPGTIHYKLNIQDKIEVEGIRLKYNLDATRIKKHLNLDVSVSTIHRYLIKKGLISKSLRHKRPRYQKTLHMNLNNTKTLGYLQMDVKYLESRITGLPWTCYEYGVIDIYSRYKQVLILNQIDQDGAIKALLELIPKFPFKVRFVQTDNGFEFQQGFVQCVRELGIEHHFIHKNTPNENAVIERSFRTDEDEFFFYQMKPVKNYDDLVEQYNNYLNWYNNERPHYGINLRTPTEVVANVLKG